MDATLDDVLARLQRVEDELAIQRLILTYGPSADAGHTARAGSLWREDGEYDWDAGRSPLPGSAGVDRMLQSDGHQQLISEGVAHIAGPPLVDLDGDRAVALTYTFVMRRTDDGISVWRLSAVRWDVERAGTSWKIRRRTNRALDDSGGGRALFGETLQSMFGDVPSEPEV